MYLNAYIKPINIPRSFISAQQDNKHTSKLTLGICFQLSNVKDKTIEDLTHSL